MTGDGSKPGSYGRALVIGMATGLVLSVILVTSRGLLGGRPVPFWLENTAGVWIAAPYLAGYFTHRKAAGALAGLITLVITLVFYESVWFVTHPNFSIQITPLFRPLWAAASVVVGVGFGLLGGWSAQPGGHRWIGVGVVGGLLAGEAVALFVGGPPHPSFHRGAAAGQVAVGAAGVGFLARGPGWWRAAALVVGLTLAVVAVEGATGLISRLVWG